MASTSRSVHSNGVSSGISRLWGFPLMVSLTMAFSTARAGLHHTASLAVNPLDQGVGTHTIVQSTRRQGSGLIPSSHLWSSRCIGDMPIPGRSYPPSTNQGNRSEEHTSELQSLRHLVCRLLLEKKKR